MHNCSFCLRTESENGVALVECPGDVYLCDKCVDVIVERRNARARERDQAFYKLKAQGMKYKDIAAQFGVCSTSVQRRVDREERRLRHEREDKVALRY